MSSESLSIARAEAITTEGITLTLDEILERIGTHRIQWLIILISAFSYADFSVQSMIPTLSAQSLMTQWPDLESRPVYFNSVFAAGAFARLVGSLCLLPLLDRFGRRNFIMICLIISTLTASLSAISPNFPTYVCLRALTLLCTSVLPAAATVYSVELVRTKVRALPGMLCQAIAALSVMFATFAASGVGAQSNDPTAWRWVSLLACILAVVPAVLLAFTWLETPRFLLAVKGNVSKAWKVIHKLSVKDSQALHSTLLGAGDVDKTRRVESLIHIQGVDESLASQNVTIFQAIILTMKGMWQILSRRDDMLLTYSLLICWGLQAFSHWGLSAYMTLFYEYIGVNVTWTTAASFLVQLPGQLILYFLMQGRFGRINSIKVFAAMCTLVHLILCLLLRYGCTNQGALTFTAMMCFFFGAPLWGPIYTYSAERYPTTLRSSAMALFTSTGSIATIVTTYVGSISLDRNRTWIYPLIWGLLRFGIVLCAFAWKYETNGANLEDRLNEDKHGMKALEARRGIMLTIPGDDEQTMR